MRFRTVLSSLLTLILLIPAASGQVMPVSATVPTGLDVALYNSLSGYTFYPGNPSQFGNLQDGGHVGYSLKTVSAGSYAVQFYLSNGTSSTGTATITAGTTTASAQIPPTGSWGKFILSSPVVMKFPEGQFSFRVSASKPVQAFNLAGILVTPAAVVGPAIPVVTQAVNNPLFGMKFYVNPYSAAGQNLDQVCSNGQKISKIAAQPQSVWFGDWNTNPHDDAVSVMKSAEAAGTVPILTVYNIPNRDCGGYSSGGARSNTDYYSWIGGLSTGIDKHKAIIILEPDAVTQYNTPGCLNPNQKSDRLSLLNNTILSFAQNAPNAMVYLDAGPSNAFPNCHVGRIF